MQRRITAFLLAVLTAFSLTACSAEEPVMPVRQTSAVKYERPALGDNYYGYINYDYIIGGQIPFGRSSFGVLDDISTALEDDVSRLIDECAENPSDDIEKNIGELYRQILDDDARESVGITPLLPVVAMVDGCKTPDELFAVCGNIYQNYGVSTFLRFMVEPDAYDSSINRLWLRNMNSIGNMKENFTKTDEGPENIGKYTQSILEGLNVDSVTAKERAKKLASMVYDIMVVSMDSADMNNMQNIYHLYSKEKFSELLSNIDTDAMLKAFGFNANEIVVLDEAQAAKINEYLTADHLQEFKDFVLLCTFHEYMEALPKSVASGIKSQDLKLDEMEKNAKNYISSVLAEEVGVVYGRSICTDEVMTMANEMLEKIKESYRSLIQNCERLSDDTKKKFIDKLDNIVFMVGYNKDYKTPYTIIPAGEGGGLLENIISIKRTKVQQEIDTFGKTVNRNRWDMTPITVNAVYNPTRNAVTLPAAMLSPAAFDPSKGEFWNLGSLGYTIAHEIGHAFDSSGYLYNETGSLDPDWMNKEDADKYKQLMEKTKAYYSSYKVLEVYSIDGELTLGENLADLGAVQCITNITDNKEELGQLFEGIAEGWVMVEYVYDVVKRLGYDTHSPDEARVNAVLPNIDKFYEVYDIKPTDKMYVAPENRIKVW